MPPRKARKEVRGARTSAAADVEVVRRAVAGTLNREVEVEVEKQPEDRWVVTLVVNGLRSPAIVLDGWEMDAMRQVPLVPAHRRGHFLRNYAALERSANHRKSAM